MRPIIYTMHFRGQMSRSSGDANLLRATASATSCRMDTVVAPDGVETTLHPATGDLAFMESELRLGAPEEFEGECSLTFGDAGDHALQFVTVSAGKLAPSGATGIMAGAAAWRIHGGSGRFSSATGFVTSTFTLTDSGELNEYQTGLVFIGGDAQ